MHEYEKKMEAIKLIASTLNPIPLRELAKKLNQMADDFETRSDPIYYEDRGGYHPA